MVGQDVTTRSAHLEGAIRGLTKLAQGRVIARSQTAQCYCTDGTHDDGLGAFTPRRRSDTEPRISSHSVTRRELTVFTAWQDDAP